MRPALFSVAGEEMCITCYSRYRAFDSLGFRARSRAVADHGIRIEDEPVIALTAPRGSKLAVVKVDGNAMSVFMSSSLTPSVYFEKSVRIDLALKRGIRAVYETIWKLLRETKSGGSVTEYLAAIAVHSFMYAGGDDALLILPHEASLATALLVAYVFAAETGFQASLSVGVAAGPREQPIWWLLDAAEELLESAKEVVRGESLAALREYPGSRVTAGGAVLYDYMASGALTGLRVDSRLSRRWRTVSRLARLFGAAPLPRLVLAAIGSPKDMVRGVTPAKLFEQPPRSMSEDEAIEAILVDVLRGVLLGSIDARSVYRTVERAAAMPGDPRIAPWVVVERLSEAAGTDGGAYHELLQLLASLADGGRLSPEQVSSLIVELYLVSKLLGG